MWGDDARVEELGTEDDDTDTQGVGLTGRRPTRFVSDSLYFTGTDLGDRTSGVMQRRQYAGDTDEDDEDGSEAYSSDEDTPDPRLEGLSPQHREEAVFQSAMARIQRAQARGSSDVKLTKEELAVLELRRKRKEQEEARRRKKGSGSGSDRKKRKEARVAVPLTQLEPVSRKKKSAPAALPARQAASEAGGSQERTGYPPMGYFSPPSGSRSRPRSGTSVSQRPPSRALDDRASSPFNYEYLHRPSSANRHASDPSARPMSSRGYPGEDVWLPRNSSGSSSSGDHRSNPDPFRFQTAGPRAPSSSGAAAASRRHMSGHAEAAYLASLGVAAPAAARSRYGSRRPSPDMTDEDAQTSEESTSDDLGNGAQIREPPRERERTRDRGREIVVEVSPDREHASSSSKKKSSGSSPSKRKPVPSERGGGRRKRK